ncbi:MAG: SMC-Scp complex subunit ScpB [bacterium]|nr:SMC-Scp complex subunit ScpB [bacterium]
MNLDAEIEAILYYKNEPMSVKKLAVITSKTDTEIREALVKLDERLKIGGLVLVSNEDEFTLGTASSASALIEKMIKDDLSYDLGKASLDTLTIILYYGPVSKMQIDNIRGVNSGFMLRNLLIRGLITREINEKDQRSYIYKSTIELLSHLGIKNTNELPEYQTLRESLDKNLTEIEKNDRETTGTQD